MWTKKRIFFQPKLKLMTVNQVQVAYAIMSIKTGMSALLAVVSGALAALSPVNTPTRLVGRCASVLG